MNDSSNDIQPNSNRNLDSVLPILLFILLNRFFGLTWGVIGATLWGIKAVIGRHQRGEMIGRYLPGLIIYLVVRGVIGIITDSEAVYFGIGIGTKALIGVALIATVFSQRSFVERFMHYVIPFERDVRRHEIYRRATSRLTVIAGVWQFITSAWDIWLFRQTSVDGYLIIRTLVGWPAATTVILGSLFYLNKMMKKIPGFTSVFDTLEQADKNRRESG
ncbi:MAG TPA: DUF3159 domain-containing protein [Acidimicrobiales bacterium]|nr:DUF3159 domain-containing protein [Acidimicrobiales bacterium]|tara:strand:- start:3268 stop:3921 length:654 start_codon:yes stop_codon:yes gene_type:complete